MKTSMHKNLKKILLSVLFLALSYTNIKAQISDAGVILQAGAADAELVLTEYLRPAAEGFSSGLNTGWFSKAGSNRLLGVDISLNVSAVNIPKSMKTFDFAALNTEKMQLQNPSQNMVPTLFGPEFETGVKLVENVNGTPMTLYEFDLPQGIDFDYMPGIMGQITVGTILNTDVSLRFIPEITLSNDIGSIRLFGLGIKHELTQWLPLTMAIPIDISIAGGYTTLIAEGKPEVDPPSGQNIRNDYPESHWGDQNIRMRSYASNYNLLVGKTVPGFSVYVGVGYEESHTRLSANGNYPVVTADPQPTNPSQMKINSLENPLNFRIEGSNYLRYLAGARFKLAILTISAEYTYADMPVGNVGIGFSF
jgi:hypothetical protein